MLKKFFLLFFLFSFVSFISYSAERQVLNDNDNSIDQFITAVKKQKELWLKDHQSSLAQGQKPQFFLFADFDGTIIYGDITEGAPARTWNGVERAAFQGLGEKVIEQGLVTYKNLKGKKGAAAYRKDYEQLVETDHTQSVLLCTSLFAKLPEKQLAKVNRFVRNYLQHELKRQLFFSSMKIISKLKEEGIELYVTSASPAQYVRNLDVIVPAASPNLVGADPSASILNYMEGKRENIKARMEQIKIESKGTIVPVPLAAMGNSWHSDGPFIEWVIDQGGVGLFINGSKGDPAKDCTSSKDRLFLAKFTQILADAKK